MSKRVLLIGGAGTIGSYVRDELLKLGFHLDIICLRDGHSDISLHDNLQYLFIKATDEFLLRYLAAQKFDAIIDFLHYSNEAEYRKRSRLLLDNTDQLIFLSSYRVYADEEHPIRETSPQLLDVSKDTYMLEHDGYGPAKSRNERILRGSGCRNWTIIRPVITFSHFRFDLVTQQSSTLIARARAGKKILLPLQAREVIAGFDWGGNVGKLIAHLVLNPAAIGEDFIVSSGQKHTWGEIASYYTQLMGAEFVWVDVNDYLAVATPNEIPDAWGLYTDRLLDRTVDVSKILTATNLTLNDFLPVRDGLARELAALPETVNFTERLGTDLNETINSKIDAYLSAHGLE